MRRTNIIAMDVRSTFCEGGYIDDSGRERSAWRKPTSIPELVEVIEAVPRPRKLVIEEGPLADWLYRNLSPRVSVIGDRSLMPEQIQVWLEAFALDAFLLPHVQTVMLGLPDSVRDELMGDAAFAICDFEPGAATVAHISISLPGRSVVLKRSLRRRSAAFILYVIAHELAHAHLRNRGRESGEDPETAADALAEAWGFPRPTAGLSEVTE